MSRKKSRITVVMPNVDLKLIVDPLLENDMYCRGDEIIVDILGTSTEYHIKGLLIKCVCKNNFHMTIIEPPILRVNVLYIGKLLVKSKMKRNQLSEIKDQIMNYSNDRMDRKKDCKGLLDYLKRNQLITEF